MKIYLRSYLLGLCLFIGLVSFVSKTTSEVDCQFSNNDDLLISVEVKKLSNDAGYTQSNFDVSESGAAVISVPIFTSPGTAGLTPELAFNYSSHGSNGLLGVGWTLGGVSTITRNQATIAQDGFINSVDFDESDRFCLDGERLMVILGKTYGKDNSEYRTEQNVFNRVKSFGNVGGGPKYFKMWTKSGLIYEFGNTEDSRIEAQGKDAVLYWAVNKIADTKGNYIKFHYSENNSTGEYRPSLIEYTANDELALEPYCSVKFYYEDRNDTTETFLSGSIQKMTKRLKQVRVYYEDIKVRDYLLTYDYSKDNAKSKLTQIKECASDGNCFQNPLIFEWQNYTPLSFTTTTNPISSSHFTANTITYFGDFNGDGITDLVLYDYETGNNKWFLNNGDFTYVVKTNPILPSNIKQGMGLLFGDWNADGISDVMWYDKDEGDNNWFINDGNADFDSFSLNPIEKNLLENGTSLHFGDWNGDGINDLLWYNKTTGNNKWFINQNDFVFTQNTTSIPNNQIIGGDGLFTGDWNLDGMTDVMWYDEASGLNNWYLKSYDQTISLVINPIYPDEIKGGEGILFADWNGDDISDVVWWDKSNGENSFFINRGDLNFDKFTNSITPSNLLNGTTLIPFDSDGNGVTDILLYNKDNGNNKWFQNNGNLVFTSETNLISPNLIDEGTSLFIGNWGSDDCPDLVWYDKENGQNNWFLNNSSQDKYIKKITNGHGAETRINYKLLTDTSVYAKEDTASYPKVDFIGHLHVVSDFEVTNCVGGFNKVSYKYFGGKMDMHGRGFRGFAKTISIDHTSGLKTINYYERDYRFISSKLKKSEQYLSDGTLIQEVENFMDLKKYYDWKVHYSYVNKSVTKTYEIDGSLTTHTTTHTDYDDYGNPLIITNDYHDGHRDSTVNEYYNDYNKWYLARLTESKVFRKSPDSEYIQRTAAFEYDTISGLLKKEYVEPGNDTLQLIKEYVHDPFGNILQSITSGWNGYEVESRVNTTTYDTQGRFVIERSNTLGHTEVRTYDSLTGNVLTSTGPNNITTSWQYDAFGRKKKEFRADGTNTEFEFKFCNDKYSSPGAVYYTYEKSSGNEPVIKYFDINNNQIRQEVTGFSGQTILSDAVYNRKGYVVKSSYPYFQGESIYWTTYEYDTVGRIITQTEPGNRVTSTSYNGLITAVTNPLGQSTTAFENTLGRTIEVQDHFGNSIFYIYDGYGNLRRLTDELGNTTLIDYDLSGNKLKIEDPDMGITQFRYNAYSETISSTNARGQTSTSSYDGLGRLIQKIEPEGIITWTYDTCAFGVGKLANIVSTDDIYEFHAYDSLGRLKEKRVEIDGEEYSSQNTYDAFGRIKEVFYPSGFGVVNNYNQFGYHSEVRRFGTNELYWKANHVNARGQIVQFDYGNGVLTTNTYDDVTGFLNNIEAIGIEDVQLLGFEHDAIGNLRTRYDDLRNLFENFTYDSLNRLTSSEVVNGFATSIQYNILGNIIFKSDVGTYLYGENNAGPHQLTSIQLADTTSCIPSLQSDYNYTSFNKVNVIFEGDKSVEFTYGPDRSRRIQRIYTNNILEKTKYYFENIYEKEIIGDTIKEVHYIRAGTGVVAVYSLINETIENTVYWHKDHIGSLQCITNDSGFVLEALSYDAWGKRRNTDTWGPIDNFGSEDKITDRGFTGHEHLDDFSLINMNGRVYDPVTGRFISPDPFVQAPDNLTSLNRYAYCLNNPLTIVDPSGYWGLGSLISGVKNIGKAIGKGIKSAGKAIGKGFKAVGKFVKKHWKPIAAIAAGIITAGAASAIAASVFSITSAWGVAVVSGAGYGFGTGFTGTLLNGGGLGSAFTAGIVGGVIGGATAGLTFGVGELVAHETVSSNFLLKSVLHGSVQGAKSELQGGSFQHGFLAAAFSASSAPILNSVSDNGIYKFTARAMIGGTGSKLGGGKFLNGAASAACVYIFNDLGKNLSKYQSAIVGFAKEGVDFIKNSRVVGYMSGVLGAASNTLSILDMSSNFQSYMSGNIGYTRYFYRQSVAAFSFGVSFVNPAIGMGTGIVGQGMEDFFDAHMNHMNNQRQRANEFFMKRFQEGNYEFAVPPVF